MEILCSVNYKNRTRNIPMKFLSIIFLLYLCEQINAKEMPNVNLSNVFSLNIQQNKTVLRLTGIDSHRSNDIRFKATFSPILCDENFLDLDFIERINYFGDGDSSTVIDISLKKFNFGENSLAYVCAKFDGTEEFVHLGRDSAFYRSEVIDGLVRDRRNTFGSTRGENKCRANEIRIDGMRIETSAYEITYDENNVPEFISRTKATLRLFGCGFTDQTMITFTQDANNRNEGCLIPSAGQFRVRPEELLEYSAVVDIVVPSAEKSYYYLCVRNADPNQKKLDSIPFIHQGTDRWLRIMSKDVIVPIWLAIVIICVCLCFSALFSGLNLGLMSLDRTELKILRNTGNQRERQYAKKIQPVRDHGNFLLCSILLGNVLVNSTFTILLDSLTSGLIAIISSTLLIVIFGEITPQAICSRHGLAVGAKTIFITKAIMVITFPLAYPTSKILDFLLGEEIGNVYNRERLKELVRVTTDVNDLDKDEVNIISGALEMRKKTVAEVMTHLEDAFMLSLDTILDFETVSEIMKSGYSRIPVYEGERHNVVKLLLIKDLALIDPDDNTPVRTLCEFYQNPCFFVFEDTKLDVMFRHFKGGQKGHMAFVQHVNNEGDGDPFYETIGLVTLEDVIEEMIQAEIVDETDVYTDNRNKKLRKIQSRKHDFTVFAERRDNQRIRISPQLTLATFQYLSTTIDAFKRDNISETILRRLLNQDVIHHIKLKHKDKNCPTLMIYQQGKPADYFVLVLEGRVEVTVGNENLLFECGPFTYFGTQALAANVVVAELENPEGSIQSLNLEAMIHHTFIPDYTVRAVTEVFYIAIKRNLYLAAKRATLMERIQKGGDDSCSHEPIDDEVEKLLHSLDEDDQSIHGSKMISPTLNTVQENPNGPISYIEGVNGTALSYQPENQTNPNFSSEKESQETDALLTKSN